MKKAFTLIEMIAVIVILAIITILTMPSILKRINSTKDSLSDAMKNIIYSASELYASNESLDRTNGNIYCVPLSKLVSLEYLNENLVDPVSKKNISLSKKVEIRVTGNSYEYNITDSCTPNPQTIENIAYNLVYENGVCKENTYNYMGGCYLKGLPDNNYIWYSGFMYRIMGINSDGSVRLITEENVTTIPWGTDGSAEDYENSYVRDWLNNYFLSNLKDTNIILNGNFCQNKTNTTTGLQRTACESETIFNDKIGLMSIDEYNLAGSNSYLNNSQYFWTMSPYSLSRNWVITNSGTVDTDSVVDSIGVRPTININDSINIIISIT